MKKKQNKRGVRGKHQIIIRCLSVITFASVTTELLDYYLASVEISVTGIWVILMAVIEISATKTWITTAQGVEISTAVLPSLCSVFIFLCTVGNDRGLEQR